jgi:hypothetical protein
MCGAQEALSAAWFTFICSEHAVAFTHTALAQYLATPIAPYKTLLDNKHQWTRCFFVEIAFHGHCIKGYLIVRWASQ